MTLLSIIIPVYNGLGHNLGRCLDSISASLSGDDSAVVEVICVDDCSDDGVTPQWLSSRGDVRCFRTPRNLRQGGARNVGVRQARGRFITFIDQDDFYHPGALAAVLSHLRNFKGDLLVTDNIEETADGSMPVINPKLGFSNLTLLPPGEFIASNGVVYAPWRMFISRQRYISCGVSFRSGTRIEDIDWGIRLLGEMRAMQFLPVTAVHWVRYPGSTTGGISTTRGIVDDYLEACLVALSDIGCYFPGNKALYDFMALNFQYTLQYMSLAPHSFREKRDMIKRLPLSLDYHPLVRCSLKFPGFTAMMMNMGKPAWRLVRALYRWRVNHRSGR